MNKLKYFGLFILIWTIYWFPDVIFAYPEIFFKSLIGYERQLASTWLLFANLLISIGLGIFLGVKFGYFKNTLSMFKIKNLLIILITFFFASILYFVTLTYYSSHFPLAGIAQTQMEYSNQIVFPWINAISFGISSPLFEEMAFRGTIYHFFKNDKLAFILASITFAWIHTGFSPVLLVYLPMSVILTTIYHRRKVLSESILLHILFNTFLPIMFSFLQFLTGIYYL